ncbi:MAG: hypothetical protein HY363_01580 [Candidatus Aenigmarchaeota archaeon]|nr:hypothetical protein [Candidatus Aenigmarchaeota archaeon]
MKKILTILLILTLIIGAAEAATTKTKTNKSETKTVSVKISKPAMLSPKISAAGCAKEQEFPTAEKPCCKGLTLREGACRPMPRDTAQGITIPCSAEGAVSLFGCCDGLVEDIQHVCRRVGSCAQAGQLAINTECCSGLTSVGVPAVCMSLGCSMEGQAPNLIVGCCAGLMTDIDTGVCKPIPEMHLPRASNTPAVRKTPASVGKCSENEQLARIEAKLDQLMRAFKSK